MRAFFPGFHWPKFHKCEQEPHPCLCKNNQVLTNSRELMNWTIWIHMLELEMVQYHRQDCTIYADVAVRKCLRTRWRKTFSETWNKVTLSNMFELFSGFWNRCSLSVTESERALQCLAVPCSLGIELFLGVRGAEAVPVCTAAKGATDLGKIEKPQTKTPWTNQLGSPRHCLALKILEDGPEMGDGTMRRF